MGRKNLITINNKIMQCPVCSGDMWDNRQKKTKATQPDFRCKDPECKMEWDYQAKIWKKSEFTTAVWENTKDQNKEKDRKNAENTFKGDLKDSQIQENIEKKNQSIKEAQEIRAAENDKLIVAIEGLTNAINNHSLTK